MRKQIGEGIKKIVWKSFIGKKEGKCLCCRRTTISYDNCHFGHIVSDKDGGEATSKNLRPICVNCNGTMGSKHMVVFMYENNFVMDETYLFGIKNQDINQATIETFETIDNENSVIITKNKYDTDRNENNDILTAKYKNETNKYECLLANDIIAILNIFKLNKEKTKKANIETLIKNNISYDDAFDELDLLKKKIDDEAKIKEEAEKKRLNDILELELYDKLHYLEIVTIINIYKLKKEKTKKANIETLINNDILYNDATNELILFKKKTLIDNKNYKENYKEKSIAIEEIMHQNEVKNEDEIEFHDDVYIKISKIYELAETKYKDNIDNIYVKCREIYDFANEEKIRFYLQMNKNSGKLVLMSNKGKYIEALLSTYKYENMILNKIGEIKLIDYSYNLYYQDGKIFKKENNYYTITYVDQTKTKCYFTQKELKKMI